MDPAAAAAATAPAAAPAAAAAKDAPGATLDQNPTSDLVTTPPSPAMAGVPREIAPGMRYRGGRDNDGLPQGAGELLFDDGGYLRGAFREGEPHGLGVYCGADGRTIRGVYKGGELNGAVEERGPDGRLEFRGEYRNGVRHGLGTLQYVDGSALVGEWFKGEFHGDKNVFEYPPVGPSRITLRGRWAHGDMETARALCGNSPLGHFEFRYDPSDSKTISSNPLVRDPFESALVRVGPSSLGEAAGEGLFARVKLPPEVVVSYYNGIRLSQAEVDARNWAKNSNTIVLTEADDGDDSDDSKCGDDSNDGVSIDVPAHFASEKVYCASLGHKVNHTFDAVRVNCVYAHCEHPRFGHIRCIRTTRAVDPGQELLVDYGYDVDNVTGHGVPGWFHRAREGYLRARKRARGAPAESAEPPSKRANNASGAMDAQ